MRKKELERLYKISMGDLSGLSTWEIKRMVSRLSPELRNEINDFGKYTANFSDFADNAYKTSATHVLLCELLDRNISNRDVARGINIKLLTGLCAFIIVFTLGYSNRSEKEKAVISEGVTTYSNGMTYSGFSANDLSSIFNYSASQEKSLLEDVIGDSIAGLGNLIFSGFIESESLTKAMNEAATFLKYSGVYVLNGVTSNEFYLKDMSVDEWKKLNLEINSDVQSLCKVYALGKLIEESALEQIDSFYKSIYYIVNGEKVYFNSKEELMNFVGFESLEEYDKFTLNVINTLNGNVFFCSVPVQEEPKLYTGVSLVRII